MQKPVANQRPDERASTEKHSNNSIRCTQLPQNELEHTETHTNTRTHTLSQHHVIKPVMNLSPEGEWTDAINEICVKRLRRRRRRRRRLGPISFA